MKTYDSDLPIIKEFVELNGKSLLDVGCGDGRLTALLVDSDRTITAIDPDEASIEAALTNIPGVNFLVGSGEDMDFADNSFDIVLFSYSLHHQNCVKALPEAQRVVRTNGKILIIEPTHDGEFTELVSIFEPQEKQLLRRTFNYVSSGSFNLLRQDMYGVDYPFKNEKDLYDYFIMNFSTAEDDLAVEKMREIIGNRMTDRSITIQDKVNIFLIGM